MEREFVPYDIALAMKELGFNEPCMNFYMGGFKELCKIKNVDNTKIDKSNVLAPLYQQAFRWFDSSTEYGGFIVPSPKEGLFTWWIQNYMEPQLSIESEESYLTREEAELACLEKLIEIVEEDE